MQQSAEGAKGGATVKLIHAQSPHLLQKLQQCSEEGQQAATGGWWSYGHQLVFSCATPVPSLCDRSQTGCCLLHAAARQFCSCTLNVRHAKPCCAVLYWAVPCRLTAWITAGSGTKISLPSTGGSRAASPLSPSPLVQGRCPHHAAGSGVNASGSTTLAAAGQASQASRCGCGSLLPQCFGWTVDTQYACTLVCCTHYVVRSTLLG
jgi:hypothetical protein